ncbi:hypothetical protein DIS09_35560 [Burkholderia pseudomallei]|nr:hypothetical protein DIS09_35560 [Burkholderia pseudomallei]
MFLFLFVWTGRAHTPASSVPLGRGGVWVRRDRRKAAPAGARHGDGTQRAARSRISTRGAPMRRARRRPARPASPGRETLIATE